MRTLLPDSQRQIAQKTIIFDTIFLPEKRSIECYFVDVRSTIADINNMDNGTTNGAKTMATLNYWYAQCMNDSDVYSIREQTRKEAKALRDENPESYGDIVKVALEYHRAFDLMQDCLGENRGYWEARAVRIWEEKTGKDYLQEWRKRNGMAA